MDLTRALKGITNWKPKPLNAAAPSQPTVEPLPPVAAAPAAPLIENIAFVGALDSLVNSAKQIVADGGDLPEPPNLPDTPPDLPALSLLRGDLATACSEAKLVGAIPPDVFTFKNELGRLDYPLDFFDHELLPLIRPTRPGIGFQVLRIEPKRVVLVAPDGTESSLYHPAHNPGFGG